MTDIDTLLERLRAAAVDHTPPQMPGAPAVRRWSPAVETGARRAILDAWASDRAVGLKQFLVPDSDDFVELAFLYCLGRSADVSGHRHYLGRLMQGVPRLEVLAQLAASAESEQFRGPPAWPFWLRPLLWALRVPLPVVPRLARAALRRFEGWLGRRVRRGNPGLLWLLAGTIDDHDRFEQGERDALAQTSAAMAQQLKAAIDRLALAESHGMATRSVTDDLAKATAAIRARIAAFEYVPSSHPETTAAAPGSETDVMRYYLTLESVFRGDPARIRAQLERDYLELLVRAREDAGGGPCVDLGCGRGEWLDVLREHGFSARGVDLNEAMTVDASAAGHEVILGDALAFLRGLADDSLLAVSAFHLAEHLEFPTLLRLVAECRRVLKPRGLLILETPNPENVWVATHTFHHDPTHRNPLTPSSLEFLVNHHGLETVAILRLHPYPEDARLPGNDPVTERLNAMTCGGQDFAVVARKTPVA